MSGARRGLTGTRYLRTGPWTKGRATGVIDDATVDKLLAFLGSYSGRFPFLLTMKRNAADASWRPTNAQARGALNCVRHDPRLSVQYNTLERPARADNAVVQ